MRSVTRIASTALLATVVSAANNCPAGSASEINGNWYCKSVDTIQYSNFGYSGSYPRITSMNEQTGECISVPQPFSGSMAPLNEEVALVFRGPAIINNLAVYSPGSGSKTKRHNHHKRHGHAHFHAHDKEIRDIQEEAEHKRGLGDWVVATMDGKVVSWRNEFGGGAAAAPTPAPAAAPAPAFSGGIAGNANNIVSAAGQAAAAPFKPSYNGDWNQIAAYDAQAQTSKGLTFLNNLGGSNGSGTFSYAFGNSLSYAASDGVSAAPSSEILAHTTLPSNKEIVIMTDKACSGSSCGFVRDGTVAKHGFPSESMVILAEFSMPLDGQTGFNMDMPAFWMLNAQIPRTLQYGKASCTSWPGSGELDIMEVLDSGNMRTKSTLHVSPEHSGGDSDWIARPTTKPIKLAVVMSNSMATIQVLNPDFEFSQTLTNAQVEGIGNHNSGGLVEDLENLGLSLFPLP